VTTFGTFSGTTLAADWTPRRVLEFTVSCGVFGPDLRSFGCDIHYGYELSVCICIALGFSNEMHGTNQITGSFHL
jgi:hypothetical protein